MVMADGWPASSAVEKLLRTINRKMSQQLLLTLSIQATKDTCVLRGIVGPVNATHGAIIHFIADPRLFRVKFTFAENVENVWKKRALVRHSCHRFLVSIRELRNIDNIEYLAQDIVAEVAAILQIILQIDLNNQKRA
jgi:hypothetical protein